MEPTKDEVLARHKRFKDTLENIDPVLKQAAAEQFHNVSPLTLTKVLDDPNQVGDNLRAYIAGFSPDARDVLERFRFEVQIERLERADLLYLVLLVEVKHRSANETF